MNWYFPSARIDSPLRRTPCLESRLNPGRPAISIPSFLSQDVSADIFKLCTDNQSATAIHSHKFFFLSICQKFMELSSAEFNVHDYFFRIQKPFSSSAVFSSLQFLLSAHQHLNVFLKFRADNQITVSHKNCKGTFIFFRQSSHFLNSNIKILCRLINRQHVLFVDRNLYFSVEPLACYDLPSLKIWPFEIITLSL